jgi:hypothetical protein
MTHLKSFSCTSHHTGSAACSHILSKFALAWSSFDSSSSLKEGRFVKGFVFYAYVALLVNLVFS